MAKKSTGIVRKIDKLGRVDISEGRTMGRLDLSAPCQSYIELWFLHFPYRIPINKTGELALEEEERTGKALSNPNILNTLSWGVIDKSVKKRPSDSACARAVVNGELRNFYLFFSHAVVKIRGKYEIEECVEGVYSEQGNDFHLIPEENRISITKEYLHYLPDIPSVGVFTMEQWEHNGGFKGRAEGQEISYEVYNRFLQENQTQPLPSRMQMTVDELRYGRALRVRAKELHGDPDYYYHSYYDKRMSIWDTSSWEGFMAAEPCAYANVNGKKRDFYMAFSKRKGETGAFCYRFEGLYSKEGYDFFLLGQAAEEELVQERVCVTEEASCKRYCFDGSLKIDVSASGEKISQEISEEEYNRFLSGYSTQPLPRRLPKDRGGEVNLEVEEEYGEYGLLRLFMEKDQKAFLDISSWEGFMTTEPCAYAEVNGEQRPFYLMFTKRKDQYREYFCRFEGVYSAQGDNIFRIPADKQNWVSTEHILWRKYIKPLPFDKSDGKRFIDYKTIFPKEK